MVMTEGEVNELVSNATKSIFKVDPAARNRSLFTMCFQKSFLQNKLMFLITRCVTQKSFLCGRRQTDRQTDRKTDCFIVVKSLQIQDDSLKENQSF